MEPDQFAGMTETTEHELRERLRELEQQNEELRRDIAEVERLACDDCKLKQLLLEEYALQHAHEAVYLIDAKHHFVYVNAEASRALGYSREELLGMTVADIDAHYSSAEIHAVQTTGIAEGTVRHETHHRRRDGTTFPVEIQSSSFEYQGQNMGIALARDIGERQRMEDELRRREKEARTLTEHSPDTIARYDRNCRRTFVNLAFAATAAGGAAALLGKKPSESPGGPNAAIYEEKIEGVLATGNADEFELVWSIEGKEICSHIHLIPEFDAAGGVESVLAVGRDISERKRYEAELHQTKSALRERNEELQAYKEQLELRVVEKTAELLASNLKLRAEIAERERAERELEVSHLQLRREIARREAGREEERKRIAREVHDELGQILTGLKLHVSNLDRICTLEANPLCEHVREIVELTDQAMGVARNIAVVLRPVEAEIGIVSALELQANRFCAVTSIRCECSFPDDALMLNERCTTAFYRIVQELLTNVAKHAGADEVKIAMRREGDHYVAQVRDNGAGFDPAAIKQDSFGLAGIRERVSALGGTLDIDTQVGRGTGVTVRIPAEVCHD